MLLLSYLDSWHTNDKHRESRHKAGESGHADGPNPAPADSERPRMNKEKCHQVSASYCQLGIVQSYAHAVSLSCGELVVSWHVLAIW